MGSPSSPPTPSPSPPAAAPSTAASPAAGPAAAGPAAVSPTATGPAATGSAAAGLAAAGSAAAPATDPSAAPAADTPAPAASVDPQTPALASSSPPPATPGSLPALSSVDEAALTPLVGPTTTPHVASLPPPAPTLTAAPSAQPAPLRWFFLGALILSAAVSFSLALPLGVGAVLGYITERRVTSLLARLKKTETPALRAGLTATFITSALLLVFLPVGLAVYVALQDLIRLLSRVDWSELGHKAEIYGTPLLTRLESLGIDLPVDQLKNKLTEFVASNAGSVGTLLGAALSYTPEALFNAAITLLGWYVFAVEGREGRDRVLPLLVPWPRALTILRETAAEVIESVIIANILVSAVQALVCLLPMLLLGVPRALVWGVLSFFLSFIPVVGTLPITLGAALWCASQGRTFGAVVMVIVAVVVGSVDNVLRPLFMRSEKADLSTLWLLVALTGGVSLCGLAGVILGPLAFSLFVAFSQALAQQDQPETRPDT